MRGHGAKPSRTPAIRRARGRAVRDDDVDPEVEAAVDVLVLVDGPHVDLVTPALVGPHGLGLAQQIRTSGRRRRPRGAGCRPRSAWASPRRRGRRAAAGGEPLGPLEGAVRERHHPHVRPAGLVAVGEVERAQHLHERLLDVPAVPRRVLGLDEGDDLLPGVDERVEQPAQGQQWPRSGSDSGGSVSPGRSASASTRPSRAPPGGRARGPRRPRRRSTCARPGGRARTRGGGRR